MNAFTYSFRNFILPRAYFIIFALLVLSGCSKTTLTKKELQAQLQELKAKSAEDNKRILSLEEELKNQTRLEELEREQHSLQAEFEKKHREIIEKSENGSLDVLSEMPSLTSPSGSPPAAAPAPSPALSEDSDQGFSFTAVRTVVVNPNPPTAPASVSPAAAAIPATAAKPLTPREAKIEMLRQDLRTEITQVFKQIKARRATRYGEKNGKETSDTYIKNSTYDPETGENKKGGRKPKLAVDLDTGLDEEFPENSTCLDNMSLSATFVRARAIRDEIIELKNQTPRGK